MACRCVFWILALAPGTARAGGFELGIELGSHAFARDVELGVTGAPITGLAGLRLGFEIVERVAIEAEGMVMPVAGAAVFGARGHLRVDALTWRLRPFLVGGAGMHAMGTTMQVDVDLGFHWGGGLRFAVTPSVELRLDVRHLIVPDRSVKGATSDFEAHAGFTYRFGRRGSPSVPVEKPPPPIVAVAPPPVTPPPPPPKPEPPGDRDNDGFRDDIDQCASQPEDRDGFDDDDGCPDPDNDKDGVLDATDRCPLEAETINGYQDDDGCPEKLIDELSGLQFAGRSARLARGARPIMEKAYQLLSTYPHLRVEIAVHTTSERGAKRNLALSKRRAQAVQKVFVKRGIAENRVVPVGVGAAEPIADNRTRQGRKMNNRIEFRVVRDEALPP